MTHPKHVNKEKPQPVRSRHDPVGPIPTDLVDRVLKAIKTKDPARFKEIFAKAVGWTSAQAMERAHRRAIRFTRNGEGRRAPSHVALKLAESLLLGQALERRVG